MNRINTEIVNIYKTLDPSEIDSYGSHISIRKGLQGRISSLLHWDLRYDQKNFAQYCIEWAQVNSGKAVGQQPNINSEFLNALNTIRTLENFQELNSSDVAQLIIAFKKETYKDQINSIVSEYAKLNKKSSQDSEYKEKASLHIDVNAYIQSIINQTKFKKEDLEAIIKKFKEDLQDGVSQSTIQTTWNSVKNALKENLIFEITCSMSAYLYVLSPSLDATLNALTYSMFFNYFWAYLFSGVVASLSVTLIGGLVSGGLQGMQTEWKKAVSDDNSFHPMVDSIIGSLYIAGSWLLIDELEKNAQIGSLFYIFAQYGIANYALKYCTMNLFFTLKSQIHQGRVNANSLLQTAMGGIIRGLIKNSMLKSLNNFFIQDIKLQLASSLQSYTSFLADTYLKEWWINQVVLKSILSSTPVWLLKESPAKLISALWLSAEIFTIGITCLSKVLEVIALATLYPVIQMPNAHREIALAMAIIGIFITYHNTHLLTEFLSA